MTTIWSESEVEIQHGSRLFLDKPEVVLIQPFLTDGIETWHTYRPRFRPLLTSYVSKRMFLLCR